jgi:hypothetical protein
MSWGAGEFNGETSLDSYFTTPAGHTGVTFVGSSGDAGAPSLWPALSSNVLAVGGTTLSITTAGGYVSESAWAGSGGGYSVYESEPSYQRGVQTTGLRTGPDVSYDANPSTGYYVYDTMGASGWYDVGGTSAGAPQWAGLIAIANQGRAANGVATLNGVNSLIYSLPSTDFHDVTAGSNGFAAHSGYDEVTGRGSPIANLVIGGLVGNAPVAPAVVIGPLPPSLISIRNFQSSGMYYSLSDDFSATLGTSSLDVSISATNAAMMQVFQQSVGLQSNSTAAPSHGDVAIDANVGEESLSYQSSGGWVLTERDGIVNGLQQMHAVNPHTAAAPSGTAPTKGPARDSHEINPSSAADSRTLEGLRLNNLDAPAAGPMPDGSAIIEWPMSDLEAIWSANHFESDFDSAAVSAVAPAVAERTSHSHGSTLLTAAVGLAIGLSQTAAKGKSQVIFTKLPRSAWPLRRSTN